MIDRLVSHPKDWAGSEREESEGEESHLGVWPGFLATDNMETTWKQHGNHQSTF